MKQLEIKFEQPQPKQLPNSCFWCCDNGGCIDKVKREKCFLS